MTPYYTHILMSLCWWPAKGLFFQLTPFLDVWTAIFTGGKGEGNICYSLASKLTKENTGKTGASPIFHLASIVENVHPHTAGCGLRNHPLHVYGVLTFIKFIN